MLVFAAMPLRAAPSAFGSSGWQQRTFSGDGGQVTLAIPGDSLPRFGFVPVRVTVNNIQSRDLRWRANFIQNSFHSSGSTAAESAVTLAAPAGRSGESWVFVPVAEAGSTRNMGGYYTGRGGLSVVVSGPGIDETRLVFNHAGGGRPDQMVPWAVSGSLEAIARARIAGMQTDRPGPGWRPPSGRRPRSGPVPGPFPLVPGGANLTAFDFTQALGDWRIWSPFARVILRADEYALLPPANRVALRNWVALGGALYLSPEQPREHGREVFGAGQIVALARPIGNEVDDGGGLMGSAGLFETTPAIPNASDLSLQKGPLTDKIPGAKRVGDWLIYFFLGFAAIVAPINLYMIAPERRRHWLFVSLPAISLAAVGILVGAIYLQDGVGGEGARRALVVLLPGDNQAAVFQDQVSRTGLLFNAGFPLTDDTICAPVPAEGSNAQTGRVLHFDRADGRATGDWFRGRARQAQHLRRIVPTRARVERVGQAAGGAPIVQSSVGAVLREFVYVDRAGVAWMTDRLPAGTPVTLRRVAGVGDYGRRVDEFASGASIHFGQVVRSSVLHPTPDRFVALASDSDLAPIPTLATVNWKDSMVMVAGVVAGPSTGTPPP